MINKEEHKRRNNGLTNRTQFTTSAKNELYSKYKELSAETRIPATKLLDEALTDLLKKYNKFNSTGLLHPVLFNFENSKFVYAYAITALTTPVPIYHSHTFFA